VPGKYTVQVSVAGYKKFEREGLTIATQQFVTLDTVMEVGAIEEAITVSGASPLIETSMRPRARSSTGRSSKRCNSRPQRLPHGGDDADGLSSGNTGFNRQNAQSGATTVSIGGGGVRRTTTSWTAFPSPI